MNKRSSLFITSACIFIILLGMVGTLFLNEDIANRVTSVITTLTALIGAIALFYQFKRDKNLNEASFLVEYSQQFYSTYNCADLMNELEHSRMDPTYQLDVDKYYRDIVGYLEWLETLSSLINSGTLQISKIDNVMSYRYFLIVNNKQVQERELLVNREFYRGIYALYPVWARYKKRRNLPIIFEENALCKTAGYQDIMKTNHATH